MAAASIRTAGVFLVLVPTVAYGGVSLLGFISRRSPGYLDNRSARTCSGPATPTPASSSSWPWAGCSMSTRPTSVTASSSWSAGA
jgi:hypothetical protein